MKNYQKPAMLVLSLSANDMLCSSCDAKTKVDTGLNSGLKIFLGDKWTDKNGDTYVGDGETNLFDDTTSCEAVYDGYCKYAGAANHVLFSS